MDIEQVDQSKTSKGNDVTITVKSLQDRVSIAWKNVNAPTCELIGFRRTEGFAAREAHPTENGTLILDSHETEGSAVDVPVEPNYEFSKGFYYSFFMRCPNRKYKKREGRYNTWDENLYWPIARFSVLLLKSKEEDNAASQASVVPEKSKGEKHKEELEKMLAETRGFYQVYNQAMKALEEKKKSGAISEEEYKDEKRILEDFKMQHKPMPGSDEE
jgi:hypothetical protein